MRKNAAALTAKKAVAKKPVKTPARKPKAAPVPRQAAERKLVEAVVTEVTFSWDEPSGSDNVVHDELGFDAADDVDADIDADDDASGSAADSESEY